MTDTDPIYNADLMERTLQRIEAHPELLDMGSFGHEATCGTVACLAGHALLESGYTYALGEREGFRHPDGKLVDPSDEAARILGLTFEQRMDLFFACDITTPAALRAHVAEVMAA